MTESTCICGATLCLPDDLAGSFGRCPQCQRFVRAAGEASVEGADPDLEKAELGDQSGRHELPPHLREAIRYLYTSSFTARFLALVTVGLFAFVLIIPPAAASFDLEGPGAAWRNKLLGVAGCDPDWPAWVVVAWGLAAWAALWFGGRGRDSRLLDQYAHWSGDLSDELVGFARAGGFDVGWWSPVATFWLVFLVFLGTWEIPLGDPLFLVRGPWTLALALAFTHRLLPLAVARHLFRARFGPPVRPTRPASRPSAASRRGHAGTVYLSRLSPDGRRVASGGADTMVCLWEAATGEHLATLRGSAGVVVCLAFSPDSDLLASSGLDSAVHLWSVATALSAGRLPVPAPLHDLAFSPDGSCLAGAGHDGRIYLWRGGGMPRALGEAGKLVRWLAVSPGGARVAARHTDGALHLFSGLVGRREHTLPGGAGPLAFSPDGRLLAAGNEPAAYQGDGQVTLWHAETGQQWAQLPVGGGRLLCLAFSPDGALLAGGSSEGILWVWDVASGAVVERQPLAEDVQDVCFGPGGLLRVLHWSGAERRPRLSAVTIHEH
jgi:hypothetical protein